MRKQINVFMIGIAVVSPQAHLVAPTFDPHQERKATLRDEDRIEKGYSLADVMKRGLTGLDQETEERRADLVKNAKWYSKERGSWKFAVLRKRINDVCERDKSKKQVCDILSGIANPAGEKTRKRSLLSYLKSLNSKIKMSHWVKEGDLSRLSSLSDGRLRQALAAAPSMSSLDRLTRSVVDLTDSCQHLSVTRLLAAKSEEFLPEPLAQERVIQLYKKAAGCGRGDHAVISKYRLSLFYVANNQCKEAAPYLNELSLAPSSTDYQARALFWHGYCAEQMNERTVVEQTQKSILRRHPFSFHSILVQQSGGKTSSSLQVPFDSDIIFRSQKNLQVNPVIELVEALLVLKETRFASEVLISNDSLIAQSEPELRVYASVLHYRLKNYLKNFQLLSAIFKANPSLISQASLRLYYPKNPLQIYDLNKHGIEQNLLLSLVRQESGFNSKARSIAGALGLMQIMPSTAKRFERIRRYDRLFDPALNLRIGSKFFSGLIQRYGGDTELALAAYNAGPGKVDRWLSRYPVKDRILFLDLIPYKETREYVASIARNYFWYTRLYPDTYPVADAAESPRKLEKGLGSIFDRLRLGPQAEPKGIP